MAHRKAAGSTQLGRDSQPKYLGVKLFDGQVVKKGQIIVRQRGSKIRAGEGTKISGDDTVISLKDGKIKFYSKKVKLFTGKLQSAKFVSVVS